MCPLAHADGIDAVWLIGEPVPGVTAVIDDFGVGSEDAIGEPVIPHELPHGFDWTELGTFDWQRDDADVFGNDKRGGHMPSGLIHGQYGMASSTTVCAISARCSFIAAVLPEGRTSSALLPRAGQTLPKM